jgi:hypothetical protein
VRAWLREHLPQVQVGDQHAAVSAMRHALDRELAQVRGAGLVCARV